MKLGGVNESVVEQISDNSVEKCAEETVSANFVSEEEFFACKKFTKI